MGKGASTTKGCMSRTDGPARVGSGVGLLIATSAVSTELMAASESRTRAGPWSEATTGELASAVIGRPLAKEALTLVFVSSDRGLDGFDLCCPTNR